MTPKIIGFWGVIYLALVDLTFVFSLAAFGPVQRPCNGKFLVLTRGVHMGAVIQADDDIAVITEL